MPQSLTRLKFEYLMMAWDRANPSPTAPALTPIPPGTPNRRALERLQYDARNAAHAASSERKAWEAARAAAAVVLKKQAASDARAIFRTVRESDPAASLKRLAQKHLRRLGFSRIATTGSGSSYYRRNDMTVRISDHEVPMTAERQWNVDNGGFSWASSGRQIMIDDGATCIGVLRDIVAIKRRIA